MSKDREKHLRQLLDLFNTKFSKKYREGSKEHKEKLWEKTTIDLLWEAFYEALDLVAYIGSAILKLQNDENKSD